MLFDEHGAAVAEADAPCEMSHPRSGWAEQDPADWERGIARTVRELRERAGVGPRRGRDARARLPGRRPGGGRRRTCAPLRPAIIWLDRRATEQSARLSDAVGEDELIARTGLNPDASHTAPKAMWLRDEEPEHYRAARWLAPVGGSPDRLADRRGGAGPGQRILHAALRPARGRLGPRAGRAGRAGPGQAAADPARGGGDRAARAAGRRRARPVHPLPRRGRHGRRAWRGARRRRRGARRRGRRDRHGRAGRGALGRAGAGRASGWSRRTPTRSPACC